MKKINKTAFVIGSTIVAGFGSTAVVADTNPFKLSELSAGYMNIAEAAAESGAMKMKDGSCGEGKCGNKKGATEDKAKEGKCGDMKKDKAKEGKCGEGKCGEGKCGDKKDAGEKTKEGKCGDKK